MSWKTAFTGVVLAAGTATALLVGGAPAQAAVGHAAVDHPTDRRCTAWHNTSTADGVVQTEACIVLEYVSGQARTRIDVVAQPYYGPDSFSASVDETENSVTEAGDVSHTSYGTVSGSTSRGYLSVSKSKDIASHYRMSATAKVTLKEGGRSFVFTLTTPGARVHY